MRHSYKPTCSDSPSKSYRPSRQSCKTDYEDSHKYCDSCKSNHHDSYRPEPEPEHHKPKPYCSCKPEPKPCSSCKPSSCGDNVAYALIKVNSGSRRRRHGKDDTTAQVDKNVSSRNIESVERVAFGRYKVTWCPGTFNCGPEKRAPVINVTPCESGALTEIVGHDSNGNDIILSELFPTEQAVVLCYHVDNCSAIVTTGRIIAPEDPTDPPPISEPIIGPPQVTGDVSFYIHAIQPRC
jgi:hypothetical protein